MRILFLAPQAVFVERGTPIAVRQAVSVLAQAGHQIDLLTFHEGSDIAIPGVIHHRIARPPFVKAVPVGLSAKKLVCDAYLAAKAASLLRKNRYDIVHAVEEAVFLAIPMKRRGRFKLVYDMDSIMSDQIVEKWPWANRLKPALWAIESVAVRSADLILPVCDAIADRIACVSGGKSHVLPDVAPAPLDHGEPVEDLRASIGIEGPLALYVGNLEGYQGIDLLLQSVALCVHSIHLVVIGGSASDILKYETEADRLGLRRRVSFLGARPLAQLPQYLRQADILCSPRTKGLNTPMKIYAYMASGRPILATDILSHTQVLSAENAVLRAATPRDFSAGLETLLARPSLGEALATKSKALVAESYSVERFTGRLLNAYATLAPASR
jgi:glycosyltransferase involved in cell wall biosynthesis